MENGINMAENPYGTVELIQSKVEPSLSFNYVVQPDGEQSTTHASIVLDSINEETGTRITTFKIKLWKLLVAEFNTHRAFSRNSASSRAVSLKKIRDRIAHDPFYPVYWGKDESGMQAREQLSQEDIVACKLIIDSHLNHALMTHEKLCKIGLHKQVSNRYLEPWMNTEIIMTATETENWKELRVEEHAQPEFMLPSEECFFLLERSTPNPIRSNHWHIPFLREQEKDYGLLTQLRISAARCARVSYFLQDGKVSDLASDMDICKRLMGERPFHASPFEHQAKALGNRFDDSDISQAEKDKLFKLQGNFRGGWYQHRGYVELGIKPYCDFE